jgi:hypothetical protein
MKYSTKVTSQNKVEFHENQAMSGGRIGLNTDMGM